MSIQLSEIDPETVSSLTDEDRYGIARDIFNNSNMMLKERFLSLFNMCWNYFGKLHRDEQDSHVYLDENCLPEQQKLFYYDFFEFNSLFFAKENPLQTLKILGIDKYYCKEMPGYEGTESLALCILFCAQMEFDDYTLCFSRR